MCVCVCMCVCMHVHVHMRVRMCMCACMCAHLGVAVGRQERGVRLGARDLAHHCHAPRRIVRVVAAKAVVHDTCTRARPVRARVHAVRNRQTWLPYVRLSLACSPDDEAVERN
jgi:hypothetical protein